METKTCNACGAVKPATDFYRNRPMPDGRLKQCRDCHRDQKKARYRKKMQNPEWLRSERVRLRQKERARRERSLPQRRAHMKVWRARQAGVICRPDSCERCGCDCTPEAHHSDYDRPLDVEWLCRNCHTAEHMREAIL